MRFTPTSENYEKIFGSELTDFMEFEKARPWANLPDFYHFTTLILLCFLTVFKVGLLIEAKMFITVDGMSGLMSKGLTFDAQEVLTHSPRYLAMFTMCFLGRTKFTAKKDTWCAI